MAILVLIGSNTKFRAVFRNIHLVAPVNSAVLFHGETGSGDEVKEEIRCS